MFTNIPLRLLLLRAMLVLFGLFAVAAVLFLGLALLKPEVTVKHSVVATLVAPGGKFEAVLTQSVVDASADYGYLVDIKSTGPDGGVERVANFYAPQKVDGAPGVDMVWAGGPILELHYHSATIAHIVEADANVAGQRVITVLKPANP